MTQHKYTALLKKELQSHNALYIAPAAAGILFSFAMPMLFQFNALNSSSLILNAEWTSALVSVGSSLLVSAVAATIWYYQFNNRLNESFTTKYEATYKKGIDSLKVYSDEDHKDGELNPGYYRRFGSIYNKKREFIGTELVTYQAKSKVNIEEVFPEDENNTKVFIAASVAIASNVLMQLILASVKSYAGLNPERFSVVNSTNHISLISAISSACLGGAAYLLQQDGKLSKAGGVLLVSTAIGGLLYLGADILFEKLNLSLATELLDTKASVALIGCAATVISSIIGISYIMLSKNSPDRIAELNQHEKSLLESNDIKH